MSLLKDGKPNGKISAFIRKAPSTYMKKIDSIIPNSDSWKLFF